MLKVLTDYLTHVTYRHEYCHQGQRGCQNCKGQFFRSVLSCYERRFTHFHMTEDIFDNNDCVVYQNTNCQGQRHQGHIIEGKVQHLHHKEGCHDGSRNTKTAHDGRTEVAQEQVGDQECQEATKKDSVPNVGNVFTNKGGLVTNDTDFNIRRNNALLQFFHSFLNAVNYVNSVSLGLLTHENQYGRFSISRAKSIFVFPIVDYVNNISNVNGFAIFISNYDFLNIVNIFILTNGTDSDFHVLVFNLTTGSIVVTVINLIEDCLEGNIIFS